MLQSVIILCGYKSFSWCKFIMIIVHYMIKDTAMHVKQVLNTCNICKIYMITAILLGHFVKFIQSQPLYLNFSVEINILYETIWPLNLFIIVIMLCDNLLFLLCCEYYALLNMHIL